MALPSVLLVPAQGFALDSRVFEIEHSVRTLSWSEWMTSSIPSLNPLLPDMEVTTIVFIQAFEVLRSSSGTITREFGADLFLIQRVIVPTQFGGIWASTFSFVGAASIRTDALVNRGVSSTSLTSSEFHGRVREFRSPGVWARDTTGSFTASADWVGLGTSSLSREHLVRVIVIPQLVLVVIRQDGIRMENSAVVALSMQYNGVEMVLGSVENRLGVISLVREGAMTMAILTADNARREWVPA